MHYRTKFLGRDRWLRTIRLFTLAFMIVTTVAACGKTGNNSKKQPPPIPVDVAVVIEQDTPLYLEAIGNVAAFNTVDVKSRVTGQLVKHAFKAGDLVSTGQQLFTIDPEPFQTKVKESEARLNQARVLYEQAQREFIRFRALHAEKAVSQEQLETKQVDMNSKLHLMQLSEAELESAKLNLGYCFISSPLDGESGEILIDDFNMVTANQDKLVTIKQVKPIKVKFSVPGKFLDQIRCYHQVYPLAVEVFVLGNDKPETGTLTLIDNLINLKTGMLMLEGTCPNPEARLWPGQFVQVRLNLTTTRGAVLVADQAVNEGPQGKYVWVIGQDRTVSMRPIEVDRRTRNMLVISKGLKPGEQVITEGQLMLYPGATIVTRGEMEKMQAAAAAQKADAQTSPQAKGAGSKP
jgi:membrane fusion protein, multidrug efflux system